MPKSSVASCQLRRRARFNLIKSLERRAANHNDNRNEERRQRDQRWADCVLLGFNFLSAGFTYLLMSVWLCCPRNEPGPALNIGNDDERDVTSGESDAEGIEQNAGDVPQGNIR